MIQQIADAAEAHDRMAEVHAFLNSVLIPAPDLLGLHHACRFKVPQCPDNGGTSDPDSLGDFIQCPRRRSRDRDENQSVDTQETPLSFSVYHVANLTA